MCVLADVHVERARYQLLNHREAEDVVRQANKHVAGPHINNEVDVIRAGKKLHGTGARDIFMSLKQVLSIEELNYGPTSRWSLA